MNSDGKLILLLIAFLLVLPLVAFPSSEAKPGAIVVPDDYPTIQQAINSVSVGETIFVKKGTYDLSEGEGLLIDKSVSLIGEESTSTIITLHPLLIQPTQPFTYPYYKGAVEITANEVCLSGLTVRSSNDGGQLCISGNRAEISNNSLGVQLLLQGSSNNIFENSLSRGIYCYNSNNIISGNTILGYGVVVGVECTSCTIKDNNIVDCSTDDARFGIRIDDGQNTVYNNTIRNCTHGISILGLSSSCDIYSNTLIDNYGGIDLFGQGSNNAFHDNYVANNTYGVLLSYTFMMTPGTNNTVYHNNFVNNLQQICTDPTYIGNYGARANIYPTGDYDNGKEGNFWSDYTGTDANHDSLGDSPYVIDNIKRDNHPLMYFWGVPSFDVLNVSSGERVGNVSINFIVSKPVTQIYYSLDGLKNETITGNTTIAGLSVGTHNITVYAQDSFGFVGSSDTTVFMIADDTSFPIIFVLTSILVVSTAIAIVGVLFYRKHVLSLG
jgi:parallel beta-helix repeat protein